MKGKRSALRVDGFDLATVLGLLLLGQGLWWVAPSLALIVVGVLVLLFGLFGALVKGASTRRGSNA